MALNAVPQYDQVGGDAENPGAPLHATNRPKKKSVFKRFQEKEISGVLRYLRCVNICNGSLLLALYPILFLLSMSDFDVTSAFFAVYCMMFATLLVCFECNIAACQVKLRKNFGFLFSFAGRTFFLLFTSTISLASGTTMGRILGGLTIINAIFNAVVLATHPAFKKNGKLNWLSDPSLGYSSAADEGRMVIQNNPALAQRAINAGMGAAASNPQAAAQMAGAAYSAQQSSGESVPKNSDPW